MEMINTSKTIAKIALMFCLTAFSASYAAQVTIEWDAAQTTVDGAPLENVHSYKVFYGDASGNYIGFVEVTDGTSATVSDLEYNKAHFFAVKTCTMEAESDFSEEIAWAAPVMLDDDNDGICDDWETEHFGSLAIANASTDTDGNGISDLDEFIAGTNPVEQNDLPTITVANGRTLSFQARKATGTGYQNRVRSYSLLYCDNLLAGNWSPVPDMAAIAAEDQIVNYDISPNQQGYYRTEISLN